VLDYPIKKKFIEGEKYDEMTHERLPKKSDKFKVEKTTPGNIDAGWFILYRTVVKFYFGASFQF
jgi:hypothetical protein